MSSRELLDLSIVESRLDSGSNPELVEIAHDLLMTIPFDEVDVVNVAAAAGVSTEVVFDQFGTSREIRLAALRVAANDLVDTLLGAIAQATELSETSGMRIRETNQALLHSTVAAYLDHVMGYPSTYDTLNKLASVDPEFGAIFQAVRSEAVKMMLQCFKLTRTPLMSLQVKSWIQYIEAMLLNWLRDPQGIGRDELLEALISGSEVYFEYFETRSEPKQITV